VYNCNGQEEEEDQEIGVKRRRSKGKKDEYA
jgi:hypothetical protein